MKAIKYHCNRGITVLEVFIGLAFLLIAVAFVAPNLQKDFGRSEMNQALGDFNQHMEMARFAARRLDTEITVDFNQGLRARNHSIRFFLPGEPNQEPVLKEYTLPENIRIDSSQDDIRFDSTGSAIRAAQIELTSESNSFLSERIMLE